MILALLLALLCYFQRQCGFAIFGLYDFPLYLRQSGKSLDLQREFNQLSYQPYTIDKLLLLSLVWIISTSINLKINDDEDINTEITLGIFLLEFAGMFAHGWIYSHFILKKDFSFKIFSKRMMKCILVIAFVIGMQFLIIFSYHLYLLQFVKLIGSLWSQIMKEDYRYQQQPSN